MADTDQIKVVIRVRPLIQREHQTGHDVCWTVQDEKVIRQRDLPSLPPYIFDQIYDRDCSTWELYSGVIAPIVEAAMNGYHGTVFAYGQSGSGKTYTMSGDKMTPGIIALAVNDIFDFIEQKPTHEFLMRASYMEIYNERIYDLLSKEDKYLKLHETVDHQINVVGLEESLVNSCEQVLGVIQKGEAKRTFAATKQNDRSSRSHCIFRIIIESRKLTEADAVMVSHLNFVDLAGSERAADNSGDRFREGCSINMSLFCLSNVISKLSEGVSNQFIGYRESKLTRILQNALGGNSKTVIVATINPSTVEESHSTLRFATRAKTIKNQPHVNEVLSDAAMLKKYRNEITRLQRLVKDMDVADIQSANEDLKKQLDEKQCLIKELTQQIVSSSSLSEKTVVQKKKMRRETWCAPKLRRQSYFPSLLPLDRFHVTINEENDADLDNGHGENLDLPFTSIPITVNDEAKTKAFLRRSDELAPSESLLSGTVGLEDTGLSTIEKDLAEEVERLEEVIKVMEGEYAKDVSKLQDRIKQLEFEQAMEVDHNDEWKKKTSASQDEVVTLKEKLDHVQHEHQLYLEENVYLQKKLWHAEEENKRLVEEASHLCNKRFDISLQEWEKLETARTSAEAEIKRLVIDLQEKEKEVAELQKDLARQEPYIARLEQHLESIKDVGNGHIQGRVKRRSGIPLAVKSDEKDGLETKDPKSVKVASVQMVECSTSTEDLLQSLEQKPPMVDVAVLTDCYLQPAFDELSVTALNSFTSDRATQLDCAKSDCHQSENVDLLQKDAFQPEDLRIFSCVSSAPDESIVSSLPCSKVENCPSIKESVLREDSKVSTPEKFEVTGKAFGSEESSTKLAHRLKRRSDTTAALPLDLDVEMSARLRDCEQEIRQLNTDNARMLEVLNQANAEIVRYKEAMEAMEQADAERLEELSEVPKMRALLSRRDMEIHRLECMNERLKDELAQQALNSSASSLSSSFTEPRRKSAMLKEREAEIWKLKEQLVQQAKHLEDIQQEKVHLEDMVVDLQNQSPNEIEDDNLQSQSPDENEHGNLQSQSSDENERSLQKQPTDENEDENSKSNERRSLTWSASSVSPIIQQSTYDEIEKEEEGYRVTVTAEELESVQKMIHEKDSLISHLKLQLQEKDEELDQMFDGQMLIPNDMIQTHLQQAEQQREQIADLTEQLKSRDEEVAKFRARDEIRQNSTSSQGEENSFLEQLIMDKMSLEETLQEKTQELNEALELSKDLQAQLDERRNVVNQLRQQHEETTEALLSTQKELMYLKINREQHDIAAQKLAEENDNVKEVDESSLVSPQNEDLSEKLRIITSEPDLNESSCVITAECKQDLQMRPAHAPEVENCSELDVKNIEQEKSGLSTCVIETTPEGQGVVEKTDTCLELTELLSEKEALCQKFKDEKEALCQKVKELSLEKESLLCQLTQIESVVTEPKEDISNRISQLSNTIETQKAQIQQMRSENDQLHFQKNALEKEIENLKAEEESLRFQIQNVEQIQNRLSAMCEQRDALKTKAQESTAKIDELTSTVEQLQADHEELTAELTWQTKESEKHQSRVEELETELCEQKQEADDLVQELEKAQKLQETSEQCQRVVEDTLEVFKTQNAQLEIDKQTLATERDEFELREEAAQKEQERLRLELKITSDRLQDKISALEMELKMDVQRKEVLEAALADKESAQHMGELLHEKLSVDLQESQAEVSTVKAALSQLQCTLQSRESEYNSLNKTSASLRAERDHLTEVKSSLEQEKTELNVKLLYLEEEVQNLRHDLSKKEGVEKMHSESEKRAALATAECLKLQDELASKLEEIEQLQKQLETSSQSAASMHSESEKRAALATAECLKLQDELASKLEEIKQLQKQLETSSQSAASSSAGSEKMIPMLDVKKMKFVLTNKINSLTKEMKTLKQFSEYKDSYIKDLQRKLLAYENEEQEDKDEKIQSLEGSLKAKEIEMVGREMLQQKTITQLSNELRSAEEIIKYKEQMINKLKGEIRRIQSEEVSFCTPAVPKAVPAVSESTLQPGDERTISSHSGIIDRYTAALLEADKRKLQKELSKAQERLKNRESELHWAKVALAKAKTGRSPVLSSSSSESVGIAKPKARKMDDEVSLTPEQKPLPANGKQSNLVSPANELQHSAGNVVRGPCSSVIKLGTSVDDGVTGPDPVSKTLWQRDDSSFHQNQVSAGGTSVDYKKDRCVLPSAVDKENTPMGIDVLAGSNASATSKPGNSPVNNEPEFLKKTRKAAPSVYRQSSKLLGKSAAEADGCKTQ